jgi:hypothetical protein
VCSGLMREIRAARNDWWRYHDHLSTHYALPPLPPSCPSPAPPVVRVAISPEAVRADEGKLADQSRFSPVQPLTSPLLSNAHDAVHEQAKGQQSYTCWPFAILDTLLLSPASFARPVEVLASHTPAQAPLPRGSNHQPRAVSSPPCLSPQSLHLHHASHQQTSGHMQAGVSRQAPGREVGSRWSDYFLRGDCERPDSMGVYLERVPQLTVFLRRLGAFSSGFLSLIEVKQAVHLRQVCRPV